MTIQVAQEPFNKGSGGSSLKHKTDSAAPFLGDDKCGEMDNAEGEGVALGHLRSLLSELC